MNDINKVVLVGRLTRDAELKYTANNQAVANFSIAVNRSVKRNDQWESEANFFDATIFGDRAKSVEKYLLRGKQVCVEGELRQDRWQAEDGQNRSKVIIIADRVQLLGSEKASGESGGQDGPPPRKNIEPGYMAPKRDDLDF